MILEESDIDLLPPSMAWMVKVIGLSAVLALVQKYGGGTPVYVPSSVIEGHVLQKLIGADAFAALVGEYGGEAIPIAKCEKATRMLLWREIRQESADGATQNSLALKHGYTVRWIRIILDGSELEDDRQEQLF
jgi:hypothetical protein